MEVINMARKLIIPVVLVVFLTLAFAGCSNNQSTKNANENSSVMSSVPISNDTTSQNITLAKVTIKKSDVDEKGFVKPEEIKVFTTAIEKGTTIENVPSELKPPPYFVYFSYSNDKTVEYFLYISQNSGWIYKNGTGEAYTLSKGSVKDLNHLLLQFTEDEAIAKVIKDHPEFPDKAGMREINEEIGGKGNKVPVKYETKVEKKAENLYSITLTRTWGIKVGSKIPVSYWKYDVSPEKVTLVEENRTGEKLVGIIK
jgi:uncharacterized membrane protein